MFANFGSKVTILEAASLFLPQEDPDIADNIATILRDQGVDIILNAHVERISHHEIKCKCIASTPNWRWMHC